MPSVPFDGLGRQDSIWVGTNDTPTTGFWSPENNDGANMVQVAAYEYDNGGVGDGNLTRSTALPDDTAPRTASPITSTTGAIARWL